jgi:hypothetical protein
MMVDGQFDSWGKCYVFQRRTPITGGRLSIDPWLIFLLI